MMLFNVKLSMLTTDVVYTVAATRHTRSPCTTPIDIICDRTTEMTSSVLAFLRPSNKVCNTHTGNKFSFIQIRDPTLRHG